MSNLIAQVDIGRNLFLNPTQAITQAPQFQSVGSLVSILLKNVYTLAGVMLFVLLIFGGISIILGAGQNDPKRAAQGKKAITAALTGFLVVFASYWIIQIVQFITGVNILSNTGL